MAIAADTLDVYIAGYRVGELRQLSAGKLSFSYDDRWMNGRIAIPLSSSMPTLVKTHEGKAVEAFLWGLLPDNEQTVARWAQRFQVSPRNPFALLSHVGRDCAGAVQFLPHGEELERKEHVAPMSDEQIGLRLRELREDAAATRRISDSGQFSLAGAQAKTAFHHDPITGQWGVPEGDTPTTHIFKPPMRGLAGQAVNELVCLKMAARLGMNTAEAQVLDFAGETAIVVKRYDRFNRDGRTYRIHQEDCCQALAVLPTLKYENVGGPGITAISRDILAASKYVNDDRHTFMAAQSFNWMIGGTDAHAKNYSILLGPNGESRLAPLYDISSILPHLGQGEIQAHMRDIKLAMRIDKVYPIDEVMPRHWERAAVAAKYSTDSMMETIRSQLAVISDVVSDCAAEVRAEGIEHDILDRMVDDISSRATKLRRIYGVEKNVEPTPAPAQEVEDAPASTPQF